MSLNAKQYITKAAVGVELIHLSGIDDTRFELYADAIAEDVAQVVGLEFNQAVSEIQYIHLLLTMSGVFNTPQFEALLTIVRSTKNVVLIDIAQDLFVTFVEEFAREDSPAPAEDSTATAQEKVPAE